MSLEEIESKGWESINASDQEDIVNGQGRRDINLNEGAITQSLRRKEKETHKKERMSTRNK